MATQRASRYTTMRKMIGNLHFLFGSVIQITKDGKFVESEGNVSQNILFLKKITFCVAKKMQLLNCLPQCLYGVGTVNQKN